MVSKKRGPIVTMETVGPSRVGSSAALSRSSRGAPPPSGTASVIAAFSPDDASLSSSCA